MQYNYTQSDIDYDSENNVSAFVNETTLITAPRTIQNGRNLTLVSNGSKVFEEARFMDEYGDSDYFTISANKKQATINMGETSSAYYSSIAYKLVDGGEPEPEPEPEPKEGYTVSALDISRLTDNSCLMTVNGSAVSVGMVISDGDSIVVTSNGSGVFKTHDNVLNGPTVAFIVLEEYEGAPYNSYDYFTLNRTTYKSATKTYSNNSSYVGIFVRTYTTRTSSGKPIDGAVFDLWADSVLELTSNGVKISKSGAEMIPYQPIKSGELLTLTCESGREFTTSPNEPTVSAYLNVGADGGGNSGYQYFTLSSDNKSATLTPTIPDGSDYISSIVTTTIQVTPEVKGTNNVYLINSDILKQVNKKRFKTVSGSGSDVSEVTYDYGQFILSVIELPFKVDDSVIILPENIILANFDTGVQANKISTDVIKWDLGSIKVDGSKLNLLDYVNTVAIIHLPRMQSVAIELEYVIDKTINIEYLIDCYTGTATVNVYSSEIDSAIFTKQVDIGVNIPYSNTHNTAALDNGNIDVGGDNGVKTPFIEIVRNDSVLADGLFTIPIIDEQELNKATGFIQVEQIDLVSKAVKGEKDELISILNRGVIIK